MHTHTYLHGKLALTTTTLLMLCAALPVLADTRFQIRRMTRNDVPLGKGQRALVAVPSRVDGSSTLVAIARGIKGWSYV